MSKAKILTMGNLRDERDKKLPLEEGDWVITMHDDLLPEGIDGTTYTGMPARVLEINEEGCKLFNPCKSHWG